MCKGISHPQMCWHMKLCQMSHKLEIYTNICFFWYVIIKCSGLHLCPMIDQEKNKTKCSFQSANVKKRETVLAASPVYIQLEWQLIGGVCRTVRDQCCLVSGLMLHRELE